MHAVKISHTAILDKKESVLALHEKSNSADLLINARIQTSPGELKKILFEILDRFKSMEGVTINEKFLSYFQPGFPNPTHRIAWQDRQSKLIIKESRDYDFNIFYEHFLYS